MAGSLRVTLHKSIVSTKQEARGTVRALGLHRIGQTVEVPDNAATRGMVRAVNFLVNVEVLETDATPRTARSRRGTLPKTQEKRS